MAFETNAMHAQDVLQALSESSRTNRNILIEYGGDWCKWSKRMESVLETPEISSFIKDNFVFLRSYVGADGSYDSSSIELPSTSFVPYFSLVRPDRTVIANQPTEGFEFLWFYKKAAILEFLKAWARL